MSLNPDVSKQAQEIIFSCQKNINNPVCLFDSLPKDRKSTQKHLVLLLDEKLIFQKYQ